MTNSLTDEVIEQVLVDEASDALDRLAAIDPDQARWLRTYLTALRRPFDHWQAKMFDQADGEEKPTKRSLEEIHHALRQSAGRVGQLKQCLQMIVGEQPWLPDVSMIGSDLQSDIDYQPLQGSAPNLLLALRKEWTRFCYLLMCAGARTIRLPESIAAPPLALGVLDTLVSVRFNLLCDQSEGNALVLKDDLDKAMAQTTWGNTLLGELTPHLAQLWLSEHRCALAAIRWATCKIDSPFDDQ